MIALLDPGPLTKAHWDRLRHYVERGGSVAMFLGRNALRPPDAYRRVQPIGRATYSPVHIASHWRTAKGQFLFLSPKSLAHPMLTLFREHQTSEWDESPVFKHWVLGELRPGANVVAAYSNNQPAIIESLRWRWTCRCRDNADVRPAKRRTTTGLESCTTTASVFHAHERPLSLFGGTDGPDMEPRR